MGIGAWGSFLDRVTSWLPIQKRKERWLNTLDNLKKEREELLHAEATIDKAKRLAAIDIRIADIHQRLRNYTAV